MRTVAGIGSKAIVVAGLVALTAWNASRSRALEAARDDYARRDYRHALRYALDHLNRRPWSREGAVLAARCLGRLNFPDDAEAYYRRAGRLPTEELVARVDMLTRTGRYQRAVAVAEELVTRQPESVAALRRLAAARLGQGDREALFKLCDRLERTPGGAVLGSLVRGVAYHDSQDPIPAVAAFERVLELDPSLREMPLPHWLFWTYLADDLLAIGRSSDATRYLAGAVARDPDARLSCLLGRALQFDGDRDAAERWFRRSAERDPAYDLPHLHLGQLALQQGRPDEALAEFERAWRLAPNRYETVYHLAITHQRLGRLAEAERWRRRTEQLRAARPADR